MADNKNKKRRSSTVRRGTGVERTSLRMNGSSRELGLKNNEYGGYGYKERTDPQKRKKSKKKKSVFSLSGSKKQENGGQRSASVNKAVPSGAQSRYSQSNIYTLRQGVSYSGSTIQTESAYRQGSSEISGNNDDTSLRQGREARKKAKTKRNSGEGAKRLAVGIFAIIFVYFGFVGYRFVTRQTIPYDSVIYGSVETPDRVTGIIIRDEAVYKAPCAGSLSFSVADLEKVKKGQVVCTVKDTEAVGSIERELEDINKSILQIQDSREDLSAFSEDIKRIDAQIGSIVDENVFDISTGSIDRLYYVKENIEKKMDSKNQMLLSEKGGSLGELADKKAERESEISKSIASLEAAEGGIVCYSFDGLEESLKVDGLDSVTESQTLMKQSDTSVNQAAGSVNRDDNVFKLILSNKWYIASYMENGKVDGWEEGDLRTIYLINGGESREIEAEVYKLERGDKKSYVVFAVTKDVLDYIGIRSITFEINRAKEGLKINNSAIAEAHNLKVPSDFINEDGIVLKKSGDSIVETVVSVSGTDNGGSFSYIPVEYGNLNAGDEIVNPEDKDDIFKITDVSTSKGIYVINTGVTEFKKINLENSVSNSTHTILDPTLNTNIEVYDRIVTDIKNISKEEKIY